MMVNLNFKRTIFYLFFFAASSSFAQSKGENSKPTKKAAAKNDGSTYFDFEETLLEGKMKAPSGMILKGRVQQSKSQMVNLRKNFRPELKKARAAVRAVRP